MQSATETPLLPRSAKRRLPLTGVPARGRSASGGLRSSPEFRRWPPKRRDTRAAGPVGELRRRLDDSGRDSTPLTVRVQPAISPSSCVGTTPATPGVVRPGPVPSPASTGDTWGSGTAGPGPFQFQRDACPSVAPALALRRKGTASAKQQTRPPGIAAACQSPRCGGGTD